MSTELKKIDVDVHNQLKSAADLHPYLQQPWRSQGIGLPTSGYPAPVSFLRPGCIPPAGGPPASDADFLVQDLIVPQQIEYAVLTGTMMDVSALLDPDHAAAIASAYNDYLAEQWLPKHTSFRGSIVVATQDPFLAAAEIERMAGHPGMVGIVISSAQSALLGQRRFHPIYEAAERHGLPIAIHPGAEGGGATPPPTPAGYPTHFLEYQMRISQSFLGHIISLVCEGVFEKYPSLKMVVLEGGISWLPHLLWRLDKNYKGLRSTVPWLKRFPSEYIRDHLLFSTQPMEDSGDPKHMLTLFDMIDAENILMFSSDYPNYDQDIAIGLLNKMSPEAQRKIMYENAKNLYRL